MADPIGGISTSINLDVTDALNEFKKFKDELKSSSTVVRDNPELDAFFSGAVTGAKDAASEVAKLRKQLDGMAKSLASVGASGGMNMSALAKSAKQIGAMDMKALAAFSGTSYRQIPDLKRGPAYSQRYTQIAERGDVAMQQRYELGFQNRYLEREIGSGDMRKRIVETVKAEREAKKLAQTHDRLIRQTKLMESQVKYGKYAGAAAYFYGQNREGISAVAGMAGRVGMGLGATAVGTAGGLAMSGFSGTVEGERFALEMRRLSLELAAVAKPLMDTFTKLARVTRQYLESGGEERQNAILRAGTTLSGAMAGAKIGSFFGPFGTAAGAAIGGGFGYMAPDIPENLRKSEILSGYSSPEMLKRHEKLRGMTPEQRENYINKSVEVYAQQMKENQQKLKMAAPQDRERLAKQFYNEAIDMRESINAMKNISKEESAGVAKSDRRQLMLTEGVGFAEAGSTYFDLAETLIRTQAAESNKVIADKLDKLIDSVDKLNK